MQAPAHSIAGEYNYEAGSRFLQRPEFPHRATRGHCLPVSSQVDPIALAILLANLQRRRGMPADEISEEGRLADAKSFRYSRSFPTSLQPDSRRFQSRPRRTLRAVPGHTEHETAHGLFSGSEAHSRQEPSVTLRVHLTLKIHSLK